MPKPSKFSELPRNTGGLSTARASCIWDQSPGKRARVVPALGADVSSRESSCAGRPYRYCAQRTRHKRHKWLPALAGGKYHARETWQAWDLRRGGPAPHLTWGHGVFDGTITITELVKYIWKGFRAGFGIAYEGPRNLLWGLKSVAKLQQNPYVSHITTFFFSLFLLHFKGPRPAPWTKDGLGAAEAHTPLLVPGEILC